MFSYRSIEINIVIHNMYQNISNLFKKNIYIALTFFFIF